ncbi:MAG: hypothetical protein PHW87_05485 [Methanothrix sp.]|nr:hypothetical protein [Methanothrix sp.]
MPQSESNLGGARFIPPLKRRGFSAPAPDDPQKSCQSSRDLQMIHFALLPALARACFI